MKHFSKLLVASGLCAAFLAPRDASAWARGVQFGLGVSAASGLNGFVGYANKNFESFWWKRLGVRLDFARTAPIKSWINSEINDIVGTQGFEIDDSLTIQQIDLTANHTALMVDFYPFGNTWFLGGWRISGGYYGGEMNVSADIENNALPGGTFEFELNGTQYQYDGGTMHGKALATWKYSGPYVGTGFDLGLIGGLKIYFDAGVVFTRKTAELNLQIPTTDLNYYNGSTWVPANTAQLETDTNAVIDDAQRELDKMKYFPVIKIGLMYRF
jgi:hypothetical protein